MAQTAAERKAKERELKKDQGMKLKQIWLDQETLQIIENYKQSHGCTDEQAIRELIKKGSE